MRLHSGAKAESKYGMLEVIYVSSEYTVKRGCRGGKTYMKTNQEKRIN